MFVTQWVHREHSTPPSLHPPGNSPGCSSGYLALLVSTHLCCAEPWQSPHQLTAPVLLSAFQLLSSRISLHQVPGPHSVTFLLFLSAFCFPLAFPISQMCHLNSKVDFSKEVYLRVSSAHTLLPYHVPQMVFKQSLTLNSLCPRSSLL